MSTCPFCSSPDFKVILFGMVKCRSCGLGYRASGYSAKDIATSEESRQAVWQDSIAPLYREGLEEIHSLLGHTGKLLDIGCGQGYFVKLAIEHGWQAEGIEVSPTALRQARDIFKLKVYDKPLEFLSIPENTYDAVTLWRVLDQLSQPRQELERIHKILKPGGIVWIRTYNFDYHYPSAMLGKLPILKKRSIQPGIIHAYGINNKSLRTVLAVTGFTDIHIKNSPLTKGDAYGSGGVIGKNVIVIIKLVFSAIWRLMEVLSFGKILKSSSLIAWAKKESK